MAEAIVASARLQFRFEATETLQNIPGAVGTTVLNDDFNHGPESYSPSSAVVVDRASYITYTIGGGGTVDIDLTALLGTQSAIDGTGKKVQGLFVKALGNNNFTIGPGASNKYHPFGTDVSPQVKSSASQKGLLLLWAPELLADVAAGAKMLRITGTAADQVNVGLWLG